jgi:2-dehydro-3-deoxyphosphogluconate aldolase/(4S)-4-hydroxy-2-oxoglutarate aldolase
MSGVFEAIQAQRLIAIIRLENYAQALAVTQALVAGGISLLEFTLTGTGAYEAITAVRQEFSSSVHVGVGTVLNAHEVEEAVAAGAQFVVTPLVRPEVIAACRSHQIPIICGALTPTEAWTAHTAGADMIKIFPARVGGPQYLRDILAPLPQLRVVATGGVGVDNARSYLDAGAIAVAAGGNLVSAQAVAQGDWEGMTARARAYVEAIRRQAGA